METKWVSVQAAAELLKVSVRTVERRVRAGDLEARLTDQGRREVLVSTPPTDTDILSDSLSAVEGRAERGMQAASVAIQATRDLAEAHAVELKRTRRVALAGWSAAAVLTIAMGAGAYLVARQAGVIDLKAADAVQLNNRLAVEADRLVEARRQADKTAAELEATRADRRQAEARAAELQARIDQAVKPTASPTWLNWLTGK